MLDDQYLKKNDARQDEKLESLEKTMTQLSIDLREMITTMKHLESRINEYNIEIKELREVTKENDKRVSSIISQQEVIRTRGRGLVTELERLRTKYHQQITDLDKKIDYEVEGLANKAEKTEEKSDNDRKWLVTTIITVVVGFSGVAVTLITIFI